MEQIVAEKSVSVSLKDLLHQDLFIFAIKNSFSCEVVKFFNSVIIHKVFYF